MNAGIDVNDIKTLIALSSTDGTTIVTLYADPTTHRLLVDSAAGGSGTVTSVSVASANGFAGTVASATTTPAITISTSVTGLLKGDGTAVTAASAGTDYVTGSSTNTFTNKTFDTAGTGNAFSINGTATTNTTGSGAVVLKQSPTINTPTLVGPALGTPVSGVATNLTGTAAGLSIGGNAATVTVADAGGDTTTFPLLATDATGSLTPTTDAGLTYNANTNALTATTFIGALTGNASTVTTNANLTGPITSSGNATAIASQTGTGTQFVMSVQPTLTGITTVATLSATTTSTLELRATTTTAIKISSGTYPIIQAYSPAAASTCMLDLALGNYHRILMPAGNITVGLSNQNLGQLFSVDVVQDATGGRTVTWFQTIKWTNGTAVVLTTTSTKIDTMVFRITATSSYQGYIAGQNL